MTGPDLVMTLSGLDLFHGLSPRVLARIADSGHQATYEQGARVLAQGDPVAGFKAFSPTGVEMHVVLRGRARVDLDGVSIAVLEPGSYFGELSLIDGLPRSADVVADAGGLTTFALSKWTFEELLESHPEVAVPMLRVLCARVRAHEARASDPE